GPVIGAAILIPLAETLHAELGHILPGIQGVVYGVAIIVIILVAPDGIYWKVRDKFARPRHSAPVESRAAVATMTLAAAPSVVACGCDPNPAVFGKSILELQNVCR